MVAWMIAAILALGSSSMYCEGNLTAYCPSYQNCVRDYYGGYSCQYHAVITSTEEPVEFNGIVMR